MDLRELFSKLANKNVTEYGSADKHPRADIVNDSSSVCLTSMSASKTSIFISITNMNEPISSEQKVLYRPWHKKAEW